MEEINLKEVTRQQYIDMINNGAKFVMCKTIDNKGIFDIAKELSILTESDLSLPQCNIREPFLPIDSKTVNHMSYYQCDPFWFEVVDSYEQMRYAVLVPCAALFPVQPQS